MSRAAWLAALVVACAEPAAHAPPAGSPDRALVRSYECNRCHALDGVPAPAPHADCVGCHRAIADGTFDAPADALAEWRPRVAPLDRAPSLRGIGGRLRREWIEQFLLHPHDVRPGLAPTMPRLAIAPEDAARLARLLAPDDAPGGALDPALADRGRALYRAHACARCHAFGGSGEAATGTDRLAPDLRFTRERMPERAVIAQIHAPRTVSPDGTMPSLVAALDDARALAAFVLHAPLAPMERPAVPARLPILERRVAFAEVEARVFRRVCWHCHSDPDFALGDGGPGNHGGFGFPPRRIDLSSYEAVLAGGLEGSIFRPGPDGTPRVVETLLARQREEAGTPVEGVRGMPLGLPALGAEDVQLVETWIAQGRPM